MKDPLEALKLAADALSKAADEKNRQKLERDRQNMLEGVARELPQMLEPLLSSIAENSRFNTDEVTRSLKEIKIGQPTIDVHVETPKADVTVTHEPIVIPEISTVGIEKAISDGISKAKFPTPTVTVNNPKAPDFPKIPDFPAFPGEFAIKGVNRKTPLPVMMMGGDGKPMSFSQSVGAGGGRGDFFTIKDIQTSSGASVIDQVDGAMKVVGALSATLTLPSGQGDSATATRVVVAGDSITSVNIVSGSSSGVTGQGDGASALRTIQAGDTVSSVNLLQINGNTPATGQNETNSGVLRVVHMTDTVVSVNIVSGSSSGVTGPGDGATATRTIQAGDTVSSVNVLQINGNTPATGLNETTSGVLRVVHMTDTALSVNIVSGSSSGVTGPGDGATATRIIQAGDTVSSINVLQINGNTPAAGQNETTSGVLRVVHMTDTSVSVNVTNATIAVTKSGTWSIDNPVDNGDSATAQRVVMAGNSAASVSATQVGTWNIATLTGVTNSIATVLTDSSGVAYSGSNPVPTTATATLSAAIGQGDTASALRVVHAGDSAASVMSQATGTNETTSGVLRVVHMTDTALSVNITNATIAVTKSGTWAIDNPVNNGDSATALRVVHAGDSSTSVAAAGDIASGTTDSGNPVKIGGIGRTTNPTAVADGQRVGFSADKLGRQLNRPIQVRDLLVTAYITLTNGTETTLATAGAGTFLDLIYVMATNTSTAAQQVDIRAVSAGNIVHSLQLGGNATVGFNLPVPWPQDATGNAWTADNADVTNSSIIVSALFTKET